MTDDQKWNWATGTGAVGSIFVFIGALLPWVTATVPLIGSLSVSGMEGDGKYTLAAGVVAFMAVIWTHFQRHLGGSILAALLGGAVAGRMLWAIADFESLTNDPELALLASLGAGIYVGLLGGIALVAGGLWSVYQVRGL